VVYPGTLHLHNTPATKNRTLQRFYFAGKITWTVKKAVQCGSKQSDEESKNN